jgi:type IV pilus assembly protein PilW
VKQIAHKGSMGRQRGFSLVELMIAMTLSLLLLAGALSILYSSRLTYAENDKLARVQETGRTVMELVLRDVRASGFNGCARPFQNGDFANDIAGGPASLLRNFAEPLNGYEVGGTVPTLHADLTGITPMADSDILVIRTARQGQPSFRSVTELLSPTNIAIEVAISAGDDVAVGTPMVIADCRGATSFIATSFTPGGAGTAEITYSGVAAGGSLTRGFDLGSSVTPVETVVYYAAPDTAGTGLALWQKLGALAPQELVAGVESLQFLYGLDTNADRVPDNYVTADNVTNWNNVVSLQMGVLVRSEQEYGNQVDGRTYSLLGTDVGPFNDRRYRSVFTTTVAVRNRAN